MVFDSLECAATWAVFFDRDHAGDVAAELALSLATSENTARNKIALARDLSTRLPNTWAALNRGDIDSMKESKIADPTAALSDEHARAVDALMADRLAGRDPARIRQATRRAVHRVDPTGSAELAGHGPLPAPIARESRRTQPPPGAASSPTR